MPHARSPRLIRLVRLFALTAVPLAVEIFVPALSSAHAAEAPAPSSARTKKEAKASKDGKEKKDSKKNGLVAGIASPIVHRHRATSAEKLRHDDADDASDDRRSNTDVKVDVHINGQRNAANPSRDAARTGKADRTEKAEGAEPALEQLPASATPDKSEHSRKSAAREAAEVVAESEPAPARRAHREGRTSRADHAVEPRTSPKIEATLDPTIHFLPMSATTLAPIDVSVDVKTSKRAGKGELHDRTQTADKTIKIDGDGAEAIDAAADLLRKSIEKGLDSDAPVAPPKRETNDPKRAKDSRDGKKADKHDKSCLKSAIDVFRGVEEEKVALATCDGQIAPGAIERMSVLVRPSSASRPIASLNELLKTTGPEVAPGVKRIDASLVKHLEEVVEHFAKNTTPSGPLAKAEISGPKVFVISGYRPSSKGSYHQAGKALDFRIDGVKNEEVVAFCKTLTDVGCGYYPHSSFVHMDVRAPGTGHVAWIDSSGPGEAPNYVASWPPPPDAGATFKSDRADKSDKANDDETAKNEADVDESSDTDAKSVPATKASTSHKHASFDKASIASEDAPADPEAISDMSQPASEVNASVEE